MPYNYLCRFVKKKLHAYFPRVVGIALDVISIENPACHAGFSIQHVAMIARMELGDIPLDSYYFFQYLSIK